MARYSSEPMTEEEYQDFLDNLSRVIASDTKRAERRAKRGRASLDVERARLDGELYGDFSSGRKEY